jgi:pantetheine-phosphate adenylyltransferase
MHTVKAIYPGSFDPLTNGHLDLIARGAQFADELVVAVLDNEEKHPLFSVGERVEMLREATREVGNVTIATFEGLLVFNLGGSVEGLVPPNVLERLKARAGRSAK